MTKFDISKCGLKAEGGKALAAGLKGNRVITELNISDNDLGENSGYSADTSGIIAIANAIPDMGAVSSINLLKNSIPVEQAQELVKIMQAKEKLTTLCGLSKKETELDFSNQHLGAGDVVLIANDISELNALTKLDISQNNLEQGHALQQITEYCTTKRIQLDTHTTPPAVDSGSML
jgi:Leucine-rich repeat (LRR) protein